MLADKIMQERKKKGWSQEELAERMDVSRQSVSKWESGLSVPDLDKIIAMSELFGVTTDYLLKDAQPETPVTTVAPAAEEGEEKGEEPLASEPPHRITLADADAYTALVKQISPAIAVGVMLCILSPIALILLSGFAELSTLPLSEGLASGLGLLVLFVLVGGAVALFVIYGARLSKYEYLKKEAFSLDADAHTEIEKRRDAYEKRHLVWVAAGVCCCLAGVVALVVPAVVMQNELLTTGMVCVLLALVAIGVLLMVRTSYIWESYQRLLRQGEFSGGKKQKRELVGTIYWTAVTALYLAVSFLTMKWGLTWVIWPVAAVLSPLVDLIAQSVQKRK